MSNAAAAKIESDEMDPNAIVEIAVKDLKNAGRAPNSRWGRIEFDKNGVGAVKVPVKDIAKLHDFGWLSLEDQEKWLGISQQAEIVASTSDVSEIQAKLDATTSANTRLAQRNAELEAKYDELQTKFQKDYTEYQAKVDAEMKTFTEQLDEARRQLADYAAQHQKLDTENAALKEQLAEATASKEEKKGKKGQ